MMNHEGHRFFWHPLPDSVPRTPGKRAETAALCPDHAPKNDKYLKKTKNSGDSDRKPPDSLSDTSHHMTGYGHGSRAR